MNKKVIAVWAAIALLSLAGCGSSQSSEDADARGRTGQKTDSATQEESVEQRAELNFQSLYKSYADEEGRDLCYLSLQYPIVQNGMDQRAVKNVNSYFSKETDILKKEAEKNSDNAREELSYLSEDERDYWSGYSVGYQVKKTRNDGSILSFVENTDEYTGGAHGNSNRKGVSFDAKTGEELTLSDVTLDVEKFRSFTEQFIATELQDEKYAQGLFDDYEDYIPDILSENTWYLSDFGMNIICNEYLIGPHAMGSMTFRIPYDSLSVYLKEDYIPTQKNMTYEIAYNEEVELDTDGDGTLNQVSVRVDPSEDMEDYDIRIDVDDTEVNVGECIFYDYDGVQILQQQNGPAMLAFSVDMMSDDYYSYIYTLKNGTAELTAEENGLILGNNVYSDQLTIEYRMDVLGTWAARAVQKVNADGTLTDPLGEYLLQNNIGDGGQAIVNTRELELTDPKNDQISQNIPVGTSLYPVRTDGSSYVILETEDGREWKLPFTRQEDTMIYIDGQPEEDLFEELPYAG